MESKRLIYLRRIQFIYLNGSLLLVFLGMFYFINSASVEIFFLVMGSLLLINSIMHLMNKDAVRILPVLNELWEYTERLINLRWKRNIAIIHIVLAVIGGGVLLVGIVLFFMEVHFFIFLPFDLYVVIFFVTIVLANLILYILDRRFFGSR